MAFLRTASLWLHLVSAAVWLGGIIFFLVVFGPAAHRLPAAEGVRILNRGRETFQTLSWIAIILLIVTGVLGFALRGAETDVVYYATVAAKVALAAAMIFHHALQAFKYAPGLAALTAATNSAVDAWPEPLLASWRKWFVLLKINAALGAVVLLLGVALNWSWR